MLLDLLNWLVFIVTAWVTGRASLILFHRIAGVVLPEKQDASRYIAAGVLFLTVYAEIISLFHAVDLAAFLLLCFITVGAEILYFVRVRKERDSDKGASKEHKNFLYSSAPAIKLIIAALILLFFLILSSLRPSSYDDYLYHAEAIAWIEKYGVVPGLANLHGRFGFNSAFLCLSALFSWSFGGQSLHALNALLAGLMTVRCVLTLPLWGKKKTIGISALLKLCCLIYIAGNTAFFSGADTDPSAILATLYCFIRFAEICEAKETGEEERFTELSGITVFAFFACTLKLSAAPSVLIMVLPLLYAVKNRRRGLIAASALGADISLIPFLARNVILTGWLLYPFSSIDLFQFDFKVPATLVDGEAESIVLWGRSTMDLIYSGYSWEELVDMPVTQWAPIWFKSLSSTGQLFVLVCTAALPLFLVYTLVSYIRKSDDRPEGWQIALTLVIAVSLLYWFISAPSERFGGVYLLCLPACIFGSLEGSGLRALKLLTVFSAAVFTALIALRFVSMPAFAMIRSQFDEVLLKPQDYEVRDMDANEMETAGGDTVIIYTPKDDLTDQGDYVHFPSAPSTSNLKVIVMRGGSVGDGFRSTQAQ